MNRKRRRQGVKKGLPWPVLAFAGILLILAAFFFASKTGGRNEGSSVGGGTGMPAMAVEPQKIDYGYIQFGNNESFKIKVTNNGEGVLAFKDAPYIEVLEGC